METYIYNPKGVCSSKMEFMIENNFIKKVKIIGGCPGNSLGVSKLIENNNIDDVILKLSGIKCGAKSTSCPDQIATALRKYKEKETK